jgi:hypothetical protein
MFVRTAVRVFAIAVLAAMAAGCGGGRAVSGLVPADGAEGASSLRRPLANPPPAQVHGWIAVALAQTIGTVGGAAGSLTGVWVSDAATGSVERVTASGATAFTTGVPHVYGLAPNPSYDGVVFDDDTGYGAQFDAGSAYLFTVPLPHGAALIPGEITYYQAQQVIFLGGNVSSGPNCADTVYVVQAEGTAAYPYIGDPGTSPCGASLYHLTSDGNNLWFGETNGSPKLLAYFNPGAGYPVDYLLPAVAAGATPEEVTAGTGGDVYFSLCGATDTHPGGGTYLVRVNASSPNETVFSTYAPCAATSDSMAYDPHDGRVWIANGTNTLTAVRVSDGAVSSYPLINPSSATSGFVAVTVGPDRSLWAFRNGDGVAHAYPDRLIGADPSYAYTLHGQPVTVQISEYDYTGSFTANILSGSSGTCSVTPVTGGAAQTAFKVASASGTACTVAFSDAAGVGTVYVPVVTKGGANIPPQPQAQP